MVADSDHLEGEAAIDARSSTLGDHPANPLGFLLRLVERFGWRGVSLVCSIILCAIVIAITFLVSRHDAEAVHNHFWVIAVGAFVAMAFAMPAVAAALSLVAHLGETRRRLLVEIDRRTVAEQRLRRLATTDDLTGLSNRRHFIERARELIAVARRYDQWVSLVVIDIDHFKAINDRHGHAAGDQALMVLATSLRSRLRTTDLAARFGGDEFVVLMPLADGPAALAAAERIRSAIAADSRGQPLKVSIGVAAAQGVRIDFDALLGEADKALYEAKRHGRDRIVSA